MDSVTFYHIEPVLGIGMPLLITAITGDEGKQWAGEMYLLLEDPESTVLQVVVTVSGNAWPEFEVSLNEKFIEDELQLQARWRLDLYRQDCGHVDKYGPLPRPVQMDKANMNAAASFWMRSQSGDRLSAIMAQTKSPSLREKLALVVTLPKFRYDPAALPQSRFA